MKTAAIVKKTQDDDFEILTIERRDLEDEDVLIEVLYCGICHSDLHVVNNEWKKTIYPVVAGHEILGKVIKLGKKASTHQINDIVGVGCIIGSCGSCSSCLCDEEQYCDQGFTLVFNTIDRITQKVNYGGFSKHIVVKQDYAVSIPKEFKETDYPKVAPLLCAGITTFSPLHHFNVGPSKKVGILGVGGLGHLAIKIAHAMGAEVVGLTHSKEKIEKAKKIGASSVIEIKNHESLANHTNSLDFILSTLSTDCDLDLFLNLLKKDGNLCLLGLPENPYPKLQASSLIYKRRSLSGSLIGSISETKLMLEFCAKHQILADIELICFSNVSKAMKTLKEGKAPFRYVIDMRNLNPNKIFKELKSQ